jgi:hypothetical protein
MVKSALVKKLVHGVLRLVANSEYGAERGRAGAKVGNFTQEFQAVALGLQGVFLRRAVAVNNDFLDLNLNGLATALGRNEDSAHFNGSPCGDALERSLGGRLKIDYALQIGSG